MKFRSIKNNKTIINALLITGLAVGLFLRFYQFGYSPRGLHNDEASIAYEAYSLSETGKDRWGYEHPVYFIAWGSGQNTLYAYSTIPFIKLFGFSVFSVRFVSGIFGLFTILFVYLILLQLLKNRTWGLFGALIYTLNPWHFMLSRWSFEENLVPFFLVAGIYCIIYANEIITSQTVLNWKQKSLVSISLLPFGIMFYGYAMTLFILPIFFLILLVKNYQFIKQNSKYYFISFLLFLIISLPFFLFILKNNILKKALWIEKFLPFSLPKMLYDRDSIIKPLPDKIRELFENFKFIYRSFGDKNIYNVTDLNVPHFLLLFAIVGMLFAIFKLKSTKQFKWQVLLAWQVSSFLVFGVFFMNLNRSMHFQTLIPVFITLGIYYLYSLIDTSIKKYFVGFVTISLVFLYSVFMMEYFVRYPYYTTFVVDYEEALKKAESYRNENENIAVTPTLIQNYLYTLVYSKFPPAQFQKSNWEHKNNRPYVYNFGHYYMLGTIEYYALDEYKNNLEYLAKQPSVIYITKKNETPIDGSSQLIFSNKFWNVYRCSKTTNFNWVWSAY